MFYFADNMSRLNDYDDVSSGEISDKDMLNLEDSRQLTSSSSSSSSDSESESSSSSSSQTVVEAPAPKRRTVAKEVSTQTTGRKRKSRHRTRAQRREAKLRREARGESRQSYVNDSIQRNVKLGPTERGLMSVSVGTHGRTVELQRRRSENSRPSSCPVPGCRYLTRKLKHHAYKVHFPPVLSDAVDLRLELDPKLHQLRHEALLSLARWILGRQSATVFDLVRFVNENRVFPVESVLIDKQVAQFTCLSHEMNWRRPNTFSLHPVNSPAVLMHWRVVLGLLRFVGNVQRNEFRLIGCGYVASPLSGNNEAPVGRSIKTVSKVADSLDAYDSHMHLDRVGLKLGQTLTMQQLLRKTLMPQPVNRVNLLGGTVVYCDPRTYPDRVLLPEGWVAAVGFHPKHAVDYNDTIRRSLRRMLNDPGVKALGEIGLDRTEPKGTWCYQETALKDVLSLATVDRPIILHVRGQSGVDGSGDVYSRCLSILRERIKHRDQLIHLHCFSGHADQVRQWRTDFPNTYFGFTGMVINFSRWQIEGLQEVPDHRILVESDSPYLTINRSVTPNLPQFIGDIAQEVAKLRCSQLDDFLRLTNRNFCKCYL